MTHSSVLSECNWCHRRRWQQFFLLFVVSLRIHENICNLPVIAFESDNIHCTLSRQYGNGIPTLGVSNLGDHVAWHIQFSRRSQVWERTQCRTAAKQDARVCSWFLVNFDKSCFQFHFETFSASASTRSQCVHRRLQIHPIWNHVWFFSFGLCEIIYCFWCEFSFKWKLFVQFTLFRNHFLLL